MGDHQDVYGKAAITVSDDSCRLGHQTQGLRVDRELMAKAGYGPREAVPFWKRMNEKGGSRPPEFLSTHPAPEARIKDIKAEIPEAMKYYKGK
jgi:Zn-dependent protease with chaperone function